MSSRALPFAMVLALLVALGLGLSWRYSVRDRHVERESPALSNASRSSNAGLPPQSAPYAVTRMSVVEIHVEFRVSPGSLVEMTEKMFRAELEVAAERTRDVPAPRTFRQVQHNQE